MGRNNKGLVCGIGINDADYTVKKTINYVMTVCPYYRKWDSMINRCYSLPSQNRKSGSMYNDCYVCDEWLIFSNFKSWMEQQDWEGKELDKDLLVENNKVYSPDICCFVPKHINIFLTISKKKASGLPIGVSIKYPTDKRVKIYKSSISVGGKLKSLGVYLTKIEAHRAWQKQKIVQVKDLINSELNLVVKQGLNRVLLKLERDYACGLETKSF